MVLSDQNTSLFNGMSYKILNSSPCILGRSKNVPVLRPPSRLL